MLKVREANDVMQNREHCEAASVDNTFFFLTYSKEGILSISSRQPVCVEDLPVWEVGAPLVAQQWIDAGEMKERNWAQARGELQARRGSQTLCYTSKKEEPAIQSSLWASSSTLLIKMRLLNHTPGRPFPSLLIAPLLCRRRADYGGKGKKRGTNERERTSTGGGGGGGARSSFARTGSATTGVQDSLLHLNKTKMEKREGGKRLAENKREGESDWTV